MGFEPTTLNDLARCSNHRNTEDSKVSRGEIVDKIWFAHRRVSCASAVRVPG